MKHFIGIRILSVRFVVITLISIFQPFTVYASEQYDWESNPCMYSDISSCSEELKLSSGSTSYSQSRQDRSTQSSYVLRFLAESYVPDNECDKYRMVLDEYLDYNDEIVSLIFNVLESPVASIYTKLNLLELISIKWEQNFNFEIVFTKYITKKFEIFRHNPNLLLKILETLCLIKPINSGSHYVLLRPFFLDQKRFNQELLKDYKIKVLRSIRYLTPSSKESVVYTDYKRQYLNAYLKEKDENLKVLFVENFANLGLFDEIDSIIADSDTPDILKIAACTSSYHIRTIPSDNREQLKVTLRRVLDSNQGTTIFKKIAAFTLGQLNKQSLCASYFSRSSK